MHNCLGVWLIANNVFLSGNSKIHSDSYFYNYMKSNPKYTTNSRFHQLYNTFLINFSVLSRKSFIVNLTRLGQLGANISPDRSSLTPQVLIGNFLKHNYPLLYELQHINLLCLYLPKKMVYPQTPNT